MRARIFKFIFLYLVALTVLPLLNYTIGLTSHKLGSLKDRYYSGDYLRYLIAQAARPFGVSLESEQVVIGKDGWLFLGDQYARSISYKREGALRHHLEEGKQIFEAANSWQTWLQQNGVKVFKILLCPDKSTIYPEYLPLWAEPKDPSRTDFLLKLNPSQVVYPKNALLSRKELEEYPFYFKTDSHWNFQGAWIGYQSLSNALASEMPEIKWLKESDISYQREAKFRASDLLRLMGLGNREFLTESDILIGGKSEISFSERAYGSNDDWVNHSAALAEIAPKRWKLTKFPNALNSSRVLWIRDSTGNSLFSLMGSTFSEILQIHTDDILYSPKDIKDVVLEYKPDYVIMSVVERSFTTLKF